MAVKTSISVKLFILVGLLTSAVILSFSYLQYRSLRDFIKSTYAAQAQILATSLNASIARSDLENPEELHNKIYKTLWLNPQILSLSLSLLENDELVIVASNDTSLIGTQMNRQARQAIEDNIVYFSTPIPSGIFYRTDVVKIITPVHISGRSAGVYEITLSTDEEAVYLNQQIRSILILSLVTIMVGSFVLFYSANWIIVAPLKKLTNAVTDISGGKPSSMIEIASKDEFGYLAQEFNLMSTRLNDIHYNLEKKVEERTSQLQASKDYLEKQSLALSNVLQDQKELYAKLQESTKQLVLSQKNLAKAQNIAKLGSWEWDIASGKLRLSDEAYNLLGVKKDDTFQPRIEWYESLVHQEDRDYFRKITEKSLTSPLVYKMEYRVVRPDGEIRHVLEQGEAQFDDSKVINVAGTILDITDIKKAEKEIMLAKDELEKRNRDLADTLKLEKELEDELRKERDRNNLIISSMAEGLLVIDDQLRIVTINPKAAQLLDTSELEAVGQKWSDFVGTFIGSKEIAFEERTSAVSFRENKVIATNLEDDHYYQTRTGRKFPVVSVTSPLIEEGKVVGVVKVFRDATVEKETRIVIEQAVKVRTKQLKEEQSKSHSILESASEGVVLTDSQGLITYVNPSLCRLMGISEESIIGKVYAEAVTVYDLKNLPIQPAMLSDAASLSYAKEGSKQYYQTSSGERVAVLVTSSAVKVDGEFKGVVRVIRDFTTEIQLQQQKDDFFSIASHELRTPLTVISGNLDTVVSGYGGSQLTEIDKQLLHDSEKASDRLIKLVNDFLNVSRLDQGRLKMRVQSMDPCTVAQEVVDELKPLAESKGLQLEYACKVKAENILADEGLLKEILINLIGNSIKFTDKGKVSLDQYREDNFIVFKISDTGSGIAPNKQNLLFQRFQQVSERTISRQAGGTGLGLYISKEFARVMGGELKLVKSELGKGSVFEVALPLHQNS